MDARRPGSASAETTHGADNEAPLLRPAEGWAWGLEIGLLTGQKYDQAMPHRLPQGTKKGSLADVPAEAVAETEGEGPADALREADGVGLTLALSDKDVKGLPERLPEADGEGLQEGLDWR